MDELDDPQLQHLLGRVSGAYPDTNVAYERLRGRVQQARRRRALVVAAASCMVLAGGVALAATGGGGSGSLQPAHGGSGVATVATTGTAPSTTGLGVHSSSSDAPATTNGAQSTTVPAPSSSTAGSGTANSGTSNSGPTSSHDGSGSGSTSPSTSDGHVAVPPDQGDTTQASPGGSLTVNVSGGALHLVAATPAAGYQENTGARVVERDRVRVEFDGTGGRWRLEVNVKSGALVWSAPEHQG